MTGGTASATATYHLTSHVQDSRSKSYTQLLPKVALTYSFDENIGNIYALVSKGYRAGGYNFQMFSDVLQTELNAHQQDAMRGDYDVEHTAADYDAINETIAYKPEESWNYEIGTHLNLFGGSTHFDLALYYCRFAINSCRSWSQTATMVVSWLMQVRVTHADLRLLCVERLSTMLSTGL